MVDNEVGVKEVTHNWKWAGADSKGGGPYGKKVYTRVMYVCRPDGWPLVKVDKNKEGCPCGATMYVVKERGTDNPWDDALTDAF